MERVSNDWVFQALMMHKNEMVKGWIRNDGDLNITNESGNTLLMHALYHNNDEIAELLLISKADVNRNGHTDWKAIHWVASMFNRNRFLNLLLQHGASIHSLTNLLETPLHVAVSNNNTEGVYTLLDAKASLNVVDSRGLTPLDINQKIGIKLITDMLLEAQSRHAKTRAVAIVFMVVAKRCIHKDLVQPIGYMIWESRNLNLWQ